MKIVAGTFRSRHLDVPKSARPTTSQVRACVFNMCQDDILDAHFADLFAGSGAMGLEAISRGASFCTFIEQDKDAYLCIKKNIELLGVIKQCNLVRQDVFQALDILQTKKPVTICYIDPPYEIEAIQILQSLDKRSLLCPKAHVFYEAPYQKGPSKTFEGLTNLVLASSRKMGDTALYHFRYL